MLDKDRDQRAPSAEHRSSGRIATLAALSNCVVTVPIRRAQSVAGHRGEKKVSLHIESSGDRREIRVFTHEDLFSEWASGKQLQSFALAAGDLALTLPPDAWLIVDPETPQEICIAPEEVPVLAYPPAVNPEGEHDQGDLSGKADSSELADRSESTRRDEPVPEKEEVINDSVAADDVHSATQDPIVLPSGDEFQGIEEESFLGAPAEELSETERKSMKDDLRCLFTRYPHIDEAYFVETGGIHSTPLLGLLGGKCSSEDRFTLIEGVAEISRKYFSEAGALEVYDDLHSPNSRSWELFNTQAPFFSRISEEGSRSYAEKLVRGDGDVPQDDRKRTLWQRLRSRYSEGEKL